MKRSLRCEMMLLLTAVIWGAGFVAQDVAAGVLQPLTFNGLRMAPATLITLLFSLYMDRAAGKKGVRDTEQTGTGVPFSQMTKKQKKTLLLGGFLCGVMLTAASCMQQIGIAQGASAGKAGFVTALYIVLVPLIGILTGKRPRPVIFFAVGLSVGGLYLLCIKGGFALEPSDSSLLLCALCFSGHILVVDFFSRRTDCVKMSCLQFATTMTLCLGLALTLETPTWAAVKAGIWPILYAGAISGGLGYTLQILGQRDTEPTVASLIMCLESVFAVLFGWLLLGDRMSAREYAGCFLMLCGILLAQWPAKPASAREANLP